MFIRFAFARLCYDNPVMLVRLIVIFAILHGTIFVSIGNTLELFLRPKQTEADSHHQGPIKADASIHEMTAEHWINCMFCLDGVNGTGDSIHQFELSCQVSSPILACFTEAFFTQQLFHHRARAPPIYS